MERPLVVFLGPTLSRAEAADILDAVYLPPAQQGSFVRAVKDHSPRAIVLIDGAFGKVPAVRHKEIFWTLAQGIPVFGAASMGALRAAELAAIGMQGFGFVFRWYATTPFAEDDEVAVAMCPPEFGSKPLSEALINIRLTLRRAGKAGILDDAERRKLEAVARQRHFSERSYDRLIEDARAAVPPLSAGTLDRLADWLATGTVDRKREDAVGLLKGLAREPDLRNHRIRTPDFVLTEAWAYDLEASGLWSGGISTTRPHRDGRADG